jgi:integrase/recombinase XerD
MPRRRTRRKKTLTWDHALDVYETHLRAKRSAARTVDGYLLEACYLQEHLGDVAPDAVTLAQLRIYVTGLLTGTATRRGRPLSAGTVAKVVTLLRTFFAFLAVEGLRADDPALRLERPRVPEAAPGDVLSVEDARRLLAATEPTTPLGLRNRAILETAYSTGLRRSELLALDLGDLRHTEREVVVRRGKGGKGRVSPLTRTAYQALVEYLARGRPELVKSHADGERALLLSTRGRRLSPNAMAHMIEQQARLAGLSVRLTPHTIRRSFATHLLQNGVSLRHIQALLGHRSLETTAIYLRLDAQEVRREVLLKHPRERFEV